jgi:hypothetical protein
MVDCVFNLSKGAEKAAGRRQEAEGKKLLYLRL